MPVKVKKVKGGFSVSTPSGVKAKKTTKKKAMKQKKLLNAAEHGWKPEDYKHPADNKMKKATNFKD